jgi:predicted transposase/invertase (TIGR01784 family)
MVDIPEEALKKYIPDYKYILTNLSEYEDNDLVGNIKLMLGLLLLKHIFDNPEDIECLLRERGHLLKEFGLGEDEISFLKSFISYLFTTELSTEKVKEIFKKKLSDQGESLVMSTYEKILEEGKKVGLEQGKKLGIEQGIEKGVSMAKKELAKQMLSKGIDVRVICECTGFSENEIKKLRY